MQNQPSSSNTSASTSRFCKYPPKTVGPRTQTSPTVFASRATGLPVESITLISTRMNGLPDVLTDASRSARSSFVERGSELSFDIEIFPQHSVIPYETKNSHPKIETARAVAVIPPNGEPPQDIIRRDDKSNDPPKGLWYSSVTMVEAKFVAVMLSRSISKSISSVRKWETITCRALTHETAYTANASTRWNIGAACNQMSALFIPISMVIATVCLWTIVCERATPLGAPVVPEV